MYFLLQLIGAPNFGVFVDFARLMLQPIVRLIHFVFVILRLVALLCFTFVIQLQVLLQFDYTLRLIERLLFLVKPVLFLLRPLIKDY